MKMEGTAEMLGAVETATSPPSQKPESKRRSKSSLSSSVEEELKNQFAEGNAEDAIELLAMNGISHSEQVARARRDMRDLRERINVIAWTKKRLMYTTAILEHTLASESKKVTSAENLIRNYLVFNRIFKSREGKLPRFGQFEYVMRNIFEGVETIDDVYARIADHKTFGEGFTKEEQAEVEAMAEEVNKASQEVEQKLLEAEEKRKQIAESAEEAEKEEEKRKGSTWEIKQSEPREYFFPNYTFQTGTRKGLNHARGRSSWEPLFLACADVANKKIEDRINSRTDMNEEEKRERIARHRFELLYEPFKFPVDSWTDKDGKEKSSRYIPDFIDINSWRVIEVKGPLTPMGREKIRLFKKYYIDGDFSGLSEEKQIVMMRLVQDKKDEIARWCKERGYPEFDHFSNYNVLGAYKWDYDLTNFNRYSGASDMPGLSEQARQQLQRGFIKTVEERIKAGKMPDIRPEQYVESDKLPEVVKFNHKEARTKGLPYEVDKPFSTKPFIPGEIVNNLFEFFKIRGENINIWLPARQTVLDTIPISQSKRDVLSAAFVISNISFRVIEGVTDFIGSLSDAQREAVLEGKSDHVIRLMQINKEDISKMLEAFRVFRSYLLDLAKSKTSVGSETFNPKNVTKFIKDSLEMFDEMALNSNELKINRRVLERLSIMTQHVKNNKAANLALITDFYSNFLLGEYQSLFSKRIFEVETMLTDTSLSDSESANASSKIDGKIREYWVNRGDSFEFRVSVAFKTLLEEKISKSLAAVIIIASEACRKKGLLIGGARELLNIIENRHYNFEKAAKYFSLTNKYGISKEEYLNVLNRLFASRHDGDDLVDKLKDLQDLADAKKEVLSSIAEIILTDQLGEEKYKKVIANFDRNYRGYQHAY